MDDLTKKQEKTYYAIKDYIEAKGYAPTIRELCVILEKSSTGTVKKSIDILKRQGYIDFVKNKNRTLRIIK